MRVAEAEARAEPDIAPAPRRPARRVGPARGCAQRLAEDAVDGVARVQRAVGVLEDHLQPCGESRSAAACADRLAVEHDRAGPVRRSGRRWPAAPSILPEPDSPTSPKASPARDLEADVASTARTARAVAEADVEVLERDHRPHRSSQAGSRSSTGSGCCGRSRAAAGSRAGRACRGAAPACSSAAGSSSTTRPAYMTSTRSQKAATSSQVVADEDQAHAALADQLVEDAPAPAAAPVTSSAEVGSSAISRSGSVTSIMAIITRWPMPPESSCG